jgi:hypothetical protein
MASLVEALKKYEDEGNNIGLQYLEQCLVRSKDKVKPNKHTEITFVTEEMNTADIYSNDPNRMLGIIVWVDRDEFIKQANS